MVFASRAYLIGRNACDMYAVVQNRWIFLVLLQAANFACLPIVASGQLQVSANCLKDGHSAFVGTRWMLQPVPARIGQALCITKPHRILGVCVAAILADPCALQFQGSRTYPRAKKARRAV